MEFSYRNLEKSSRGGDRVGAWKGYKVFAASKNELNNLGNGAYYILYDDNNRIVRKGNNDNWYCYGTVDVNGNVNEFEMRAPYCVKPQEVAVAHSVDKGGSAASKTEVAAVDVDFMLSKAVEDMLASARTASIDVLLDGFNYGLD